MVYGVRELEYPCWHCYPLQLWGWWRRCLWWQSLPCRWGRIWGVLFHLPMTLLPYKIRHMSLIYMTRLPYIEVQKRIHLPYKKTYFPNRLFLVLWNRRYFKWLSPKYSSMYNPTMLFQMLFKVKYTFHLRYTIQTRLMC